VPNYRRWIRDIEELQTVKMNFSLLADPDCAVLASVSTACMASRFTFCLGVFSHANCNTGAVGDIAQTLSFRM